MGNFLWVRANGRDRGAELVRALDVELQDAGFEESVEEIPLGDGQRAFAPLARKRGESRGDELS